jgi:hypothetical protein
MKIKILGNKINVEIIIFLILIGVAIGFTITYSCSRENFHNSAPIGGGLKQYDFSKHGIEYNKGTVQNQPTNPMKPGQKYFWANNKFTPECCDYSSVSGGNGCACVTDEQMKYLSSRGGNRSSSTDEFN